LGTVRRPRDDVEAGQHGPPPTASATLHDREGIVPLWTVLSQGSPGLAESTGELHTGTRG
jgi:hypothetical protein